MRGRAAVRFIDTLPGEHMATKLMRTVCLALFSSFVFSSVATTSPGHAEEKPPAASNTNAVGASKEWKSTIDGASSVIGRTFDEAQLNLIERVNGYFNALTDLQGRFLQSTSDNQQSKGKFYVKRPGKFRFNYAAPSRLVILSDGRYLSVEDHDLKTTDQYALESTPFRLLLAKNVDIMRDAQVLDLFEAEKLIALTMRDKSGDSPGTIKLFFEKMEDGAIQLKEWVITDAQGIDTRIQVAQLVVGKAVNPNLFKASKIGFPSIND